MDKETGTVYSAQRAYHTDKGTFVFTGMYTTWKTSTVNPWCGLTHSFGNVQTKAKPYLRSRWGWIRVPDMFFVKFA
jgi:hypothetical protein